MTRGKGLNSAYAGGEARTCILESLAGSVAPESKQIKANLGRLGSFTKKQSLISLLVFKTSLTKMYQIIDNKAFYVPYN